MEFRQTPVGGAFIIEPSPHVDERGRFLRAWCAREFSESGINFLPVQANMGFSIRKGTVRGMHFQETPAEEAKLIRCTRGAMFDVVVDLRPGSPTYLRWHGAVLSADNGRMMYVPELCAHGYQTLEESTEMYYMASAFYAPGAARGVRFDDPALAIDWPLPPCAVSHQDQSWPLLGQPRSEELVLRVTAGKHTGGEQKE
jgi:dTDP-4-dehydrorhamnose 3,5-epimerase